MAALTYRPNPLAPQLEEARRRMRSIAAGAPPPPHVANVMAPVRVGEAALQSRSRRRATRQGRCLADAIRLAVWR